MYDVQTIEKLLSSTPRLIVITGLFKALIKQKSQILCLALEIQCMPFPIFQPFYTYKTLINT